jgi:hypothetical protein
MYAKIDFGIKDIFVSHFTCKNTFLLVKYYKSIFARNSSFLKVKTKFSEGFLTFCKQNVMKPLFLQSKNLENKT